MLLGDRDSNLCMGKKVIVVYFSLTGHVEGTAKIIQGTLDADILSLKPKKGVNPKGVTKFLWGGFQAKMKKIPELESYEFDADKYDLVVLGSPVWAWNLSPPIRAFVTQNNLKGKDVAFWMNSMGPTKKVSGRVRNVLEGSNVISELHLVDPQDKNWENNHSLAKEWAESLK
jgi:Flavodoxin